MLDPVRRLTAMFAPGSQPARDTDLGESRLFRFGLEWEPADKLARESASAEANGYPHGISTVDRTNRADAVAASRTDLEQHFRVVQAGRNRSHHTVVLPKPMTDDVAELVNQLFGRQRS